MAGVTVKPVLTYIAQHRIHFSEPGGQHQVFEAGDEFRCADEQIVAGLRAVKAILLPSEMEGPKSAEAQALRQAELEAQNAAMAARIAELEAAAAAAKSSGKGGGKASAAAASDGE